MAGQANGGQVTKPVRPHNPLNQGRRHNPMDMGRYVGNPNHIAQAQAVKNNPNILNAQLNTPAGFAPINDAPNLGIGQRPPIQDTMMRNPDGTPFGGGGSFSQVVPGQTTMETGGMLPMPSPMPGQPDLRQPIAAPAEIGGMINPITGKVDHGMGNEGGIPGYVGDGIQGKSADLVAQQRSQQPANINTLAAEGIKGAGFNTAQGMGYNPLSMGALSSEQLAPYMNPYTTEVIDASQADLLRGANMGLDQLGAQANRAKAFGGSRHGVAMSELGRGVGELMGQQASGLRQANFAQAQEAARQNQLANQQADLQAQGQRMGAAGQLANISNLGFDMGQTVNQNLQNQGAMQQALQQMILDNAQNKFAGYTGHPAAGIGYLSNALGNTPSTSTDTTTKTPGLFDYLTLGASMMGK